MAVLSVAAVGCGKQETDPWLAALRDEPVATMVPPGGKLVLAVETEPHTALGKPVKARILRRFSFGDEARAVHGRDAVVDAATSSGWRVNTHPVHTGDPLYGAKRLPVGAATLAIGEYRNADGYQVSVQLDQGACPEGLCGAR